MNYFHVLLQRQSNCMCILKGTSTCKSVTCNTNTCIYKVICRLHMTDTKSGYWFQLSNNVFRKEKYNVNVIIYKQSVFVHAFSSVNTIKIQIHIIQKNMRFLQCAGVQVFSNLNYLKRITAGIGNPWPSGHIRPMYDFCPAH